MTDSHGGMSQEEASDLRAAESLINAGNWAGAKPVLQRLATANRAEPRYRALLAFVLGHEAKLAGDGTRARAEWDRALQLDPEIAARGVRRRRGSIVQRLLGR
ncbi:MAG: hypothetical protein IPI49_07815 [Myxococcales bacterium]|nr:hypothetical protein [Myxococcales bacterium]HRC55521.1 hypothetical protein [Kofleriaceae bacterium]